ARRGVDEYWIVDWPRRVIDVYRLGGGKLAHVATLREGDTLTSPLLPGMDMPLARIFAGLPTEEAPEGECHCYATGHPGVHPGRPFPCLRTLIIRYPCADHARYMRRFGTWQLMIYDDISGSCEKAPACHSQNSPARLAGRCGRCRTTRR